MKKLRSDIERYYAMREYRGDVSTSKLLVACLNPRMAPVVLLRLA